MNIIHNCDIIYKFTYISINLFRQKSLDEGFGVKKYSVPKYCGFLSKNTH